MYFPCGLVKYSFPFAVAIIVLCFFVFVKYLSFVEKVDLASEVYDRGWVDRFCFSSVNLLASKVDTVYW